MKIFGIGLQKTGTSSLGRALEILGYKINHAYNENLVKHLIKEDINVLFDEAKKWDAFEDNPWPMIYKELDLEFPGSKFILTLRDENSWIKSLVKHYGTRSNDFQYWYYKAPCPEGHESEYIKRYRMHNEEVTRYFKDRPEDFLVVDWEKGDGWEKLCEFLGKELPDTAFPHWNKNKTFTDYIKKRFRGLKMKFKKLV